MPSFARRAGIAFFDTLMGPLSYAVPGTHISHISTRCRARIFPGHAYFRARIFPLPLEGEKQPAPYVQTKFGEFDGTFSPDGRWVAYTSDESGRREVYIQGFPERRGKWQVSAEGEFPPDGGRMGRNCIGSGRTVERWWRRRWSCWRRG